MPVVTTSSDEYDDIALPTQINITQGGTLKAGDTRPALIAELRDADGKPIPLAGVREVTLHMASEGRREAVATGPMDILDLGTGRVRYAWARSETAKAQTYRLEIDVTYNDGTVITVPTEGFGEVTIAERATRRGQARTGGGSGRPGAIDQGGAGTGGSRGPSR